MPFDAKGYRQAATQAGIPRDVIEKTIADRTGVAGWLTGGKSGIGGFLTGVGNVLNLPSYAIGGMLNRGQEIFGSQYAQGEPGGGLGFIEGIKNKRAVMSELPETLGVDPNSGMGKVIGFGGELLTPDLLGSAGDAFKFFRGASNVGDTGLFARGLSKTGDIADTAAGNLAVRALKPSPSDIQKIEATLPKGQNLAGFLKQEKLYGGGRDIYEQLNPIIKAEQKAYNQLARSGQKISPGDFSNMLEARARQITQTDFSPEALDVANNLRKRAKMWKSQVGKMDEVPIDVLTNTKSSAFSRTPAGTLADPTKMAGSEEAGRIGVNLLEKYAPGSKASGQRLRTLRELQSVSKRVSGKGEGSQIFNAFKPGFAGAQGGFIGGSALGNPMVGAIVGTGIGAASSNPAVLSGLSRAGGTYNAFTKSPIAALGANLLQRGAGTGIRTSLGQRPPMQSPQQKSTSPMGTPISGVQGIRLQKKLKTYTDSLPQDQGGINYNPFRKVKNVATNRY